jgi:F0F1-type ATP synthase assembly protein I
LDIKLIAAHVRRKRMLMLKRRLQRQESVQDENQISPSRQNNRGRSERWWIAGILTVAIIVGGVIGFFSLPGDLNVGAHFFTAFLGMVVFLLLGGMLIAGIERVRANRQSRLSFFLWSIIVLASSILGFFILPATLLVPIRVFLGAAFGYIGLYLLVALITNPLDFFGQMMKSSIEDGGCCLGFFSLFIAITGTLSSLLIWHSVLLNWLVILAFS